MRACDLGARLPPLRDRRHHTSSFDHDMGLVLGVCDRIYVLEFGRVIASGTPDVIRNSPQVIEAYLGWNTREGTDDEEEAE